MHAAQVLHCAFILWTCLHKTAFAADKADCGQSATLPVIDTSAQENTNATQGAWPWMAAIRKRDKSGDYVYWCSGFLIDKRNVLSVAHCYEDKNKDVYRVGIGNINQNEADEYRITRIAVPPGYKRDFYYDDIAILTLDREVDFPNYNPVCLPDQKVRGMFLADKDATETAWGSTTRGGKIPINLQQISGITKVRNQECQRSFRQAIRGNFRRQFPQGMSKSFLCAGFIEGGKDICAGSSGGPLMIKDRNRWFAVGISSFSFSCNVPGMPSVWTSVSHYLEWIRENIEVCGVSNSILPIEKTLTNVTEGAWPWMVSIKSRETSGSFTNWCSGFLIDRRHILSAAQCYRRKDTDHYRARIGNTNQDEAEEYRITRILVPEYYNEDSTFYDDIALLTLDREVNSENFSPVCLPDGEVGKMELGGESATIAGWTGDDANIYMQQMGQLPVIDNPSCQKIFSETVRNDFERKFPIGINKGIVCAGYMDDTKDICQFHSGTPLMIQNKNQWYAVGILSFGYCASNRGVVPDGYTRVSNYLDWIRENIND